MSFQPSLFNNTLSDATKNPQPQTIARDGAHLIYIPQWLSHHSLADSSIDSAAYYQQLKEQVAWEQTEITLYGKKMRIPRLNAWYGDTGCGYRYSGSYFEPLPWIPVIDQLKQRIEKAVKQYITEMPLLALNSVLVNCYRNGQDSVAWHSDDEPELGQNPVIVSLSLGHSRAFHLKHKTDKACEKIRLSLGDGDLLIMLGETQHHWHHQMPKTRKAVGERINLTFRHIVK